ncbi:MAG: PAS domain-containing protein [Candidatus Limnocylindrales bacterium]
MILRVYRARGAAEARGIVLAHLRDHVYGANVGTTGLRTFQAGLSEHEDGTLELALVSTWATFDDLQRGIGEDTLRPTWLAAVASHLSPVSADHYELVGEELTGIVPLAGGALRMLSGRLAPGHGETFFDFARRAQAEQLDSGLILVSHIGRRLVDDGEEAVYVTVWRDPGAPETLGGSATGPANRGQWEPYFADWSFTTYDAVARVAPKRGEPTVLLLVDDDRRYVFATAAAGRLLGRSPARLLGRRVEDFATPTARDDVAKMWDAFLRDGSQSGSFDVTSGDGSTVAMHYEARANTPWPGVHASVLADSPAAVDFDDALAAAGIVARYELAQTA